MKELVCLLPTILQFAIFHFEKFYTLRCNNEFRYDSERGSMGVVSVVLYMQMGGTRLGHWRGTYPEETFLKILNRSCLHSVQI